MAGYSSRKEIRQKKVEVLILSETRCQIHIRSDVIPSSHQGCLDLVSALVSYLLFAMLLNNILIKSSVKLAPNLRGSLF